LISRGDADTLPAMTLPPKPTAREFGEAAKAARCAAGVTIEAIAEKTKITPRSLAALESGEFAKLPSRTFARLFLRQYCEMIGERPESWVHAFEAAWERFCQDSQTFRIAEPAPVRKRRVGPWLVGAALVAAAVVGLLLVDQRQRGSRNAALPPTPAALLPLLAPTPLPEPTETPVAEPTPRAPARGTLAIKTQGRQCWIEVRVAGEQPVSRLLAAESSWEIEARGREVDVLVGDAGAVSVFYFGEKHDPVGRSGVVARLHIAPPGSGESGPR
jgi:cytoskeleton protein RodZ